MLSIPVMEGIVFVYIFRAISFTGYLNEYSQSACLLQLIRCFLFANVNESLSISRGSGSMSVDAIIFLRHLANRVRTGSTPAGMCLARARCRILSLVSRQLAHDILVACFHITWEFLENVSSIRTNFVIRIRQSVPALFAGFTCKLYHVSRDYIRRQYLKLPRGAFLRINLPGTSPFPCHSSFI